jgi:hypothetical protein
MDIKQTKVIDENRDSFYQQLYPQQLDSKLQLVNLDLFSNDCVLIDCCGWHYKSIFSSKNIVSLETVKSAVQFKLLPNKFDKIIDDHHDHVIKWPSLQKISNPVLVFDRSPMLKYRSINNLNEVLNTAAEKYCASQVIVHLDTTFIDDPRLVDRFYNLSTINIVCFTVREFVYNTNNNKLYIHFKRNHD